MAKTYYLNEETPSVKGQITLYDIKNIKLEFTRECFQEIKKKKGTEMKSYHKTTLYHISGTDDSDDMSLVITNVESPHFANGFLSFTNNYGPFESSDPKWSRKSSSVVKFTFKNDKQIEKLMSSILSEELRGEYAVHLNGDAYIYSGMVIEKIKYETVDTSKK